MKAARIYQRVSTEEQNLERQNALIEKAKAEGYYIAGVYKEKASGVRADRPVLNKLIADLQEGDVPSILTVLLVCHWLKQKSW